MAKRAQRLFWLSTILTTAVIGVGLHEWWKPQLAQLPPRIPFPINSEIYPSAYGKGTTDHYFCYFGIFGVGDRIRNSDVVCVGTSHFMYGLSASRLTEHLRSFYGRDVRAFNMGLAFADLAFQAQCLERLHIKNKTLLIDSFAPEQERISVWADKVKQSDIVGAYVQVSEIWGDLLRDWIFDPLFPRISFQNGNLVIQRCVSMLVTRRWESGDIETIWAPVSGPIYQRGVPPYPNQEREMGTGEGSFANRPNNGVGLPEALRNLVKENSLKTILTLYPFAGYKPDVARRISAETGFPLILIPPDGLRYHDEHHLNAPSRDMATDRLFDLSRQQNIDFINPEDSGIKK